MARLHFPGTILALLSATACVPPEPPPLTPNPNAQKVDDGPQLEEWAQPANVNEVEVAAAGDTQAKSSEDAESKSTDDDVLNMDDDEKDSSPSPPPSGTLKDHPDSPLTALEIQTIVRQEVPSLRSDCWVPAHQENPKGAREARIQADVSIDTQGSVTQVVTESSDALGYPALSDCISSKVQTWRFPQSSANTTVKIPFVFQGARGE